MLRVQSHHMEMLIIGTGYMARHCSSVEADRETPNGIAYCLLKLCACTEFCIAAIRMDMVHLQLLAPNYHHVYYMFTGSSMFYCQWFIRVIGFLSHDKCM